MKKERMMADLLLFRETTQRAWAMEATPTAAAANPTDDQEDADSKWIETLAAELVKASNAEEELLHPTTDVERTKAADKVEIAELDAKIDQLEKEMCFDIATVSTAKGNDKCQPPHCQKWTPAQECHRISQQAISQWWRQQVYLPSRLLSWSGCGKDRFHCRCIHYKEATQGIVLWLPTQRRQKNLLPQFLPHY
jgi:hypothetical protein